MRGYAKLPNQILLCGMNASDKKDILSYKKEVSKKTKNQSRITAKLAPNSSKILLISPIFHFLSYGLRCRLLF